MTPLLSFSYNHKNNVPLPSHLFPPVPTQAWFSCCAESSLLPAHQRVWRSYKWIIRWSPWVLVLWDSPYYLSLLPTRVSLMQLGTNWFCWNNSLFWCIAGYDPEIIIGGKKLLLYHSRREATCFECPSLVCLVPFEPFTCSFWGPLSDRAVTCFWVCRAPAPAGLLLPPCDIHHCPETGGLS